MRYRIDNHLDLLLIALQKRQMIHIDPQSEFFWKIGWCKRCLVSLFSGKHNWLNEFSHQFILHVDKQEKVPVHFGLGAEVVLQGIDFQGYLTVLQWLEPRVVSSQLRYALQRRIIALRYRIGQVNGGENPVAMQEDILQDLQKAAYEWKRLHPLLYEKSLKERELYQLQLTSCYPEFAELLLEDQKLRERFFDWVLRDHNAVEVFILFPGIVQKIVDHNLSGRLGRLGGHLLRIRRVPSSEGDLQQIVTMNFEGRDCSILDDTAVVEFRGGYQLTLKQIFESFRKKNREPGSLELLRDGITNWNTHYYGFYDAQADKLVQIDLEQPEWWRQLPLFEVMDKEEAQMRYGWHLNGENWNAAAAASRGTPTLNYEETHAYLELAIPLDHDHYAIYVFGKCAYRFPANEFDRLTMFAENLRATVAYPDENVYYMHRQHANHSFSLTPAEGKLLMDSIKADLKEAWAGNFVYQIESDNCAKWLHEKIELVVGNERMPNLFKVPLLEAEPTGFMAFAFKILRALPKSWQIPVFMICHLPLAPFRGAWINENGKKVFKSLMRHEFWKTGIVYLPSYLHHQKGSGTLALAARLRKEELDPVPGWIKQFGGAWKQSGPNFAYSHSHSFKVADID